jgi:hypothetical protein
VHAERTLRLRPHTVGFWTTLLLLTSCGFEAPADSLVINQFNANVQHYDHLRAMLAEDPKLGTIGEDFLFEVNKDFERVSLGQLGLTERRLAEYKRLMARVGAERLDRYEDGSVSFSLWGSGFAGHTHHKGIAWLTWTPTSDTLRRYTLIRDNWYLYQD